MKKVEAGDKARVKFRLLEFEAEGGGAALQDGLRQFVTALSRGSAPAPRALPPRPVEQGARGTADVPVNGELFPVAPEATEGDTEVDATPEAPPSNSEPRQARRYSTPPIVKGLKLDGLSEFVEKAKAEGHTERYLVSAVWLKRERNISEFTAGHAFTIYKLLDWGSAPKDVGMPLRALKRESLMDSGESPGSYVVNEAGEAKVDRRVSGS
jgi:hypothetical protein